jgi:hypothetical protein
MNMDEPFPLEAVPSRVRHALLGEFRGRCPSVREVEQIPDRDWLATPGMGPASLEIVRSITIPCRDQAGGDATSPRLSDAELLRRLKQIQKDLRWLEAHMKAQLPSEQRRKPHAHDYSRPPRNKANRLRHWVGGGEAPRSQSQ